MSTLKNRQVCYLLTIIGICLLVFGLGSGAVGWQADQEFAAQATEAFHRESVTHVLVDRGDADVKLFHLAQDGLASKEPPINTWAHFTAMAISALIIILCVVAHYEALRIWSLYAHKIPIKPRLRVLLGIFYITFLHFVEIWFFAFGFAYMDGVSFLGELAGLAHDGILEYVYFSAVCYSTLGFGDIIPHGPLRLLSASEALLGLIMITWSASYTYLQMQRDWHRGGD